MKRSFGTSNLPRKRQQTGGAHEIFRVVFGGHGDVAHFLFMATFDFGLWLRFGGQWFEYELGNSTLGFDHNRNGAQVIFTTHNPLLLDPTFLWRDPIWFVDKDNEGGSFV